MHKAIFYCDFSYSGNVDYSKIHPTSLKSYCLKNNLLLLSEEIIKKPKTCSFSLSLGTYLAWPLRIHSEQLQVLIKLQIIKLFNHNGSVWQNRSFRHHFKRQYSVVVSVSVARSHQNMCFWTYTSICKFTSNTCLKMRLKKNRVYFLWKRVIPFFLECSF